MTVISKECAQFYDLKNNFKKSEFFGKIETRGKYKHL